MDNYGESLKLDLDEAGDYYEAPFVRKAEQQKYLEELIRRIGLVPSKVIDLCCGAGASSYHLADLFPQAEFTLVDFNRQAHELSSRYLDSVRLRFVESDYRDLDGSLGGFDLALCLQSLSFVEEPQVLLGKLLELTRPGGYAVVSSLFNLDCDVDVYSEVVDHTRKSAQAGLRYHYNTFSARTIRSWLTGQASASEFHRFEMTIDLPKPGDGLGSHTVRLDSSGRLTVSGGMLMNWAFLVIRK